MKPIYKFLILLVLVLIYNPIVAQTTDIARIEYTYFPQSDSENSFKRFRTFFNFPIKLKKEGSYLVPGIEYRNVAFNYEDPVSFETFDLNKFQSFTATLGYTSEINDLWRFGAEVGLKVASNFSRDDILKDDLIYTGAIYFVKIKEDERYYEPWRLILGLRYSTTTGFPFPLPIISYYKRYSENWSYTLGIPKTNIKYYFNDKHAMQGFVTLDGFFANIQENFNVAPLDANNSDFAESISMTVVLSGLGYEYAFTDHIKFYFYAGYTILNDIRLRDDNRDDVYTINDSNSVYTRGGLKFTIF